MKKIKWFALFLSVLLLSLPLLSCRGIASSTPTSKTSAAEDSGATAVGNAAHIGDSVSYGDFTIVLKGIEQTNGTAYSSPEAGNVYVLFKLEVKNNSTDDAYFNSLYFEAYADDYSAKSVALVSFAKDGAESVSGTIAAGKKQLGYVAFEVDKEWQQMELHYREILKKEKVIFEVTNPKK